MSVDPELRRLVEAMVFHGVTVWPSTACGRGGVGGQMMTTTHHSELLVELAETALRRVVRLDADDPAADEMTLDAVDVAWQAMYPGAASLLEAPRPPRWAGPDGRPA